MNSETSPTPETPESCPVSTSRRGFLAAAGLGTAAIAGGLALSNGGAAVLSRVFGHRGLPQLPPRTQPNITAEVLITRVASYDDDARLVDTISRGLVELGLDLDRVRGATILLKPNLVEPSTAAPQINTHPRFIRAVAEAFRKFDAGEVLVAEGQGHCRDTDYVLEQSGLKAILDEDGIEFIDLNHDDIFVARNPMGATNLPELFLPATLKRADFIVSLPKMKTHHWAGVTLSMKNMFGVMPGLCYGWPKNVLHYQGIMQSILDINATVRPHLAIVDGIVGMDGDGPIMGNPKPAGLITMGFDLPAVDATCARLMEIDPNRVWYLAQADGRLGATAVV